MESARNPPAVGAGRPGTGTLPPRALPRALLRSAGEAGEVKTPHGLAEGRVRAAGGEGAEPPGTAAQAGGRPEPPSPQGRSSGPVRRIRTGGRRLAAARPASSATTRAGERTPRGTPGRESTHAPGARDGGWRVGPPAVAPRAGAEGRGVRRETARRRLRTERAHGVSPPPGAPSVRRSRWAHAGGAPAPRESGPGKRSPSLARGSRPPAGPAAKGELNPRRRSRGSPTLLPSREASGCASAAGRRWGIIGVVARPARRTS